MNVKLYPYRLELYRLTINKQCISIDLLSQPSLKFAEGFHFDGFITVSVILNSRGDHRALYSTDDKFNDPDKFLVLSDFID